MPREWWPSTDAMRAIVESSGPWPSPFPATNGSFLPLDVDAYDGLAIVVGYGPSRRGDEILGVDEFQETKAGTWRHLGGGGSGGRGLDERHLLPDADHALHLRMSGSSLAPFLLEPERRGCSFAIFLCGPDVVGVDVRRQLGTRSADVSAGPGWLGVLWTPGDRAHLDAYAADGTLSFRWTAPEQGPV